MDSIKITELKIKHNKIIKFMQEHDGIIDWDHQDITPEISKLLFDAIPDVIQSYIYTETYMLNDEFEE